MATCEWISTVVLFGLISRPGLPCLRAAVAAYLFHCFIICLPYPFVRDFLAASRRRFEALRYLLCV
jgi:hypothetical protein